MRFFWTGLLLCFCAAHAQVTFNPNALAGVQSAQPATSPAHRKTSAAPVSRAPGPVPALKRPPVATVPPEIATLPPPVAVPTRPVPKIVPPKPVAGAVGDAVAIKGGLRLDFGNGSSDLNAGMDQALRAFARRAGPGPISLVAYAAPDDADPSTPRRLSLARMLAARAVLIDAGIASEKIYVQEHAPEPSGAAGPADRLEIVSLPANPS